MGKMDVQLLEIGLRLTRGVVYAIKWCFRSVCSHPFIFGFFCFMMFLYRSFHLVFSLLVSTSPILVCTAVLLGILLSYGQPNMPEIEMEGDRIDEIVSRKVRASGGVVVEENGRRFSEWRMDELEPLAKHLDSVVDKPGDHASDAAVPLIEERTKEIRFSDGEIGEVNRNVGGLRGVVEVKLDREVVENHYAPLVEEEKDEKSGSDEESDVDSFDSEKVNVDSLDSPPRSPWARAAEGEVKEEEKDEAGDGGLDSGSDRDESLSPDASMVDILPILDELHPLLDDGFHQPIRESRASSDAASERSLSSDAGTHESGDEIEDHMDSDDANAENDEGEEEDGQGDEEELLKSAITWTEEDQKNLMELRSSEIERNQQLENLIMRRKARSLGLDKETENHEDVDVADDDNEDGEDEEDAQEDKEEEMKSGITWTAEDQKNLMDLGWSEIERNRRLENLILRRRAKKNMSMLPERNLVGLESFDLPLNIAPISTRRQNPFDLPHDSDDGSRLPPIPGSAPSVLLPRRNPFDIPYDSGEEKPDLLGDEFQEEFTATQLRESFFQRHESFNVRPSRFARQDGKMRPYFVPEQTFSEESSYSRFQRQSSELSDSKVSYIPETESTSSLEDLEGRKLVEEDEAQEINGISEARELIEGGLSRDPEPIFRHEVIEGYRHQEPEPTTILESVAEHIRQESQSSEEEDSSESDEHEVNEIQFQSHDATDHYPQGITTRHVEVRATVYHLDSEAVEQRDSRDLSSPSLSEVSERAFTEAGDKGLSVPEIIRDRVADERGIATQPSLGSNDLTTMSTVVTVIPDRAPVYDLSPRQVRENLSSSPITSSMPAESDLGFPPVLVERSVPFVEFASEGTHWMNIPINDEMLPGSSSLAPLDKSRPKDVLNTKDHATVSTDLDHVNVSTDLSGLGQRSESEGFSASSIFTSHVPIPLESLVEVSAEEKIREQLTRDEVPSSSMDKSIHFLVKPEDQNQDQSVEDKHSLVFKTNNLVEVSRSTFEGYLRAEQSFDMDHTALSPNSDVDVRHEVEEKSISTHYAEWHTTVFNDKPMMEPNSEQLSMLASSTPVHLCEDEPITQKQIFLRSKSVITTPHQISSLDLASSPSDTFETTGSHLGRQLTAGDIDEIKEIDVLLSELDDVGDFNSNQWGSTSSGFEKHIDPVGERFLSAQHSKASTMTAIEVHSVEEHNIDASMRSEFSREEIQTSLVPIFLVRDAEVSHQDIGANEIEKPVVLEPPETDVVVKAITGHSEEQARHANSGVTSPVLEASFSEVRPFEDTALHYKQGNDDSTEKLKLSDSVDRAVPVFESAKTQGSSLELHVTDAISSEDLTLSMKQFLDGNKGKQLKINSDDGLAELKRDKVDSSFEVSIVKEEVGAFTPEKPGHEVDAPKDLRSSVSVKDKGKASQNSNSSSISESSSGDSDQE